MNILITGAAGFIGSHLARELAHQGHRVRGLLMPREDGQTLEASGIEIVRGDLTAPDTLAGAAEDIDIVFHLAARTIDWGTRKQFEAIMVDGTRNILQASKGHTSRFVYCSSVAAYGLDRDLAGFDEDRATRMCGVPYCDTKIIAENLVKQYCGANGLAYTIVRPANVFGPGSVWVKEMLDAFRRGPLPLIDKGRVPGAFVYVDNLVRGMILAGLADIAAGRTYLFRDDYPITWGEYLRTIGGWIGKTPRGNLSFRMAWTLGAVCEALLTPLGIRPPLTRLSVGVMGKDLSVDAGRARRELGWKSRISQDQAMQRIKEWVESDYL
ncbi:oxidoreductase [Desulfosarcina widdelii]|uniref:Oxidoreductase n=1 Tax=Desulfosarcina widdelii TaxID=947919 RepID=A0A5K7Z6C9_9BACT|nr:NAD-dependent epimerase/dehydratase family protein [Desulfosarcina widdelii]BBO75221.1 oxidoreductase [Desulfosarcina widdelii]